MCGILGAFGSTDCLQENTINDALEKMVHRGPNDRGFELLKFGELQGVLGHTRLSIIDLSDAGHQPMWSNDRRYALIFNGEIYNYLELRDKLVKLGYEFNSASDTEVLLYAWIEWNEAVLPKLTGMFAFCIYDSHLGTLTLVRDSFGIKPLFYVRNASGMYFASEVGALTALSGISLKANAQTAYEYLVYGDYDHSNESFFSDVEQIPPATLLTYNIRSGEEQRSVWWDPDTTLTSTLSYSEAAAKLRTMFLTNVKQHLRSDVPVGVALSGGLDSSAVVCAIRYLEPDIPINTFSFIARDSSVDEEVWVDQVNEYVGAKAHKILVEPLELADDLDDMVRIQGEPFASTSIYAQYRVFKKVRESGVVVTLDGQGADELLAGYSGYPGARLLSLFQEGRFIKMLKFLHYWRLWPNRSVKHAIFSLLQHFVPRFLKNKAMALSGRASRPTWLKRGFEKEFAVNPERRNIPGKSEHSGRQLSHQLKFSLFNTLSCLLRHADRNSMRWSVESRVPFLTPDIAEFLLSLPEEYLISNDGETKHIFREAMKGIVPDSILDRRDKIGFATPEEHWLKKLKPEIIEWCRSAKNIPFIDAEELEKQVIQSIDNDGRVTGMNWRVVNYCRWYGLVIGKGNV